MKLALLLTAAAMLTVVGCSIFTPARIDSAAEAAACVLVNRKLPPEQIAIRCGLEVLDVLRVQQAQDKAFAEEKAASKCAP